MPISQARPQRRARRGFTLIETIISLTLVLSVLAMSTQLLISQARMVSQQSGRLEAQQNVQFSLANLDREVRVAGIGVVGTQPIVVQADARVLTINTDLVSRVIGDPSPVYVDQDADSSSTEVFRHQDHVALPLSTVQYPNSTYMQNTGVPSAAETISFWVSHDSTSTASDEYLLFRRVNSDPARVVAKGIRVNPTDTIFQYFRRDSTGMSIPISPGLLPLIHTATVHGAANDTGKSALTDSITSVRVRMTAMYKDRNGIQIIRRIDMTIQLMNAGLVRHTDCGNPPLPVTPTGSVVTDSVTGLPMAKVVWAKSGDEGGGEMDVERYAIFRRADSTAAFIDAVASVPAGNSTYTFYDRNVHSGDLWEYGVTAQDCTPSSSPMGGTTKITIP
jgi:prepilin-type N-terminal cleavage/methylation domain-containing protein